MGRALIHKSNNPTIHSEMAECRGLAPLARGHALVSTEARLACPVGIPGRKWGVGVLE